MMVRVLVSAATMESEIAHHEIRLVGQKVVFQGALLLAEAQAERRHACQVDDDDGDIERVQSHAAEFSWVDGSGRSFGRSVPAPVSYGARFRKASKIGERKCHELRAAELQDRAAIVRHALSPRVRQPRYRKKAWGDLSKPGNTLAKLRLPRWRETASPSTRRKSVVSARSRPSLSCDGSRPGQRP